MRAQFFAPLAVAAVLAVATPATDWIVGPAGSGAPFSSIQAAINAAQPGDRVLVYPGLYSGTISITKGLELLGTSSTTVVFVSGPGPSGSLTPPIRVANLPAGSRVRIAGMRFDTVPSTALALTYLMQVDQCVGRVEVNDVVLRGASLPLVQSGQAGASLHIRNCAQVVLSGVRATGSQPPLAAFPGAPGQANGVPGISIEQSSVWLADCLVEGNAASTPSSGFGGDGGDGMVAVGSFVQISRSVLRGASSGGLQNGVAGAGGAGFSASASTVLIHGGGGNSVAGAVAWETAPQGIVALGSAGPGARADFASTFAHGVDVPIAGGAGSATLPAAPPIIQAPTTVVYALPDRLPTVSLTPAAVPLGTTLTVTLSGQPGDHFRVVALQTAPAVPQPGAYGLLLVDLATALNIEVVTLGASGSATVLVVPQDPALLGIQIVEQAAQALSFGILLSPPVLCSVVP